MINELKVALADLVFCLSGAIDLISPSIANHHQRVAYIALQLAQELKLPAEERNRLIIASLLHDCGALSLKERLEALEFEVQKPYLHAVLGYQLLSQFPPLAHLAPIILYHHLTWREYRNVPFREMIPFSSQILFLADRIDALTLPHSEGLPPKKQIIDRILEGQGSMFAPQLVGVFQSLAVRESFWLDLFSPWLRAILADEAGLTTVELDLQRLLALTKLFAQLVDFRNRFTATHSSGVAVCAEKIGQLCGFSQREAKLLRVAGYLHDFGKITVPETILNKPSSLNSVEFGMIKSHPYYTYRLLHSLTGLATLNQWAAFHHERLDGKGYPFHLPASELSLGSRIVAVADFFTALSEDRPYRHGMPHQKIIRLLSEQARNGGLDPDLVERVIGQAADLNSLRSQAQHEANREYEHFMESAYLDAARFPFPPPPPSVAAGLIRPVAEAL